MAEQRASKKLGQQKNYINVNQHLLRQYSSKPDLRSHDNTRQQSVKQNLDQEQYKFKFFQAIKWDVIKSIKASLIQQNLELQASRKRKLHWGSHITALVCYTKVLSAFQKQRSLVYKQ